ncbi:MAG: hypothetical protein ACI9G1_004100 [Pirellulaceae bacterium]|jgi:hypothetical protein
MLDAWTRFPRWFKFGTAIVVLGLSIHAASEGFISPWGFGVGGLLLLMAFMRPLGPRQ